MSLEERIIIRSLENGPLTSSEVLSACGFSDQANMLERAATGTCQWDQSPYFTSLTRLVSAGEVRWRYRDDLTVEYDLASRLPENRSSGSSDICLALRTFFGSVVESLGSGNMLSVPNELPFFNVLTIPRRDKLPISVFYDGDNIELLVYDFTADFDPLSSAEVVQRKAGFMQPLYSWPWPCDPKVVAESVAAAAVL